MRDNQAVYKRATRPSETPQDDPGVDSESKLLLMRAGMVHLQPSVLEYVVYNGGLEVEMVELMFTVQRST